MIYFEFSIFMFMYLLYLFRRFTFLFQCWKQIKYAANFKIFNLFLEQVFLRFENNGTKKKLKYRYFGAIP